MTGSPKIEFKRDAAPSVFAPMPWTLSRGRDRVLDALGRPIGTCNPKTAQFILAAVNERAAMLAEIDRLRQAVADEREACAALVDRMAAELLSRSQSFSEADKYEDYARASAEAEHGWPILRAAVAAIRARPTP